MCGLVGAAGDTTGRVKDVFTDLLMTDGLRGLHSTGAAVVHRKTQNIDWVKAPGPSQPFVCSKDYAQMLRQVNLQVLIGHNRHATIGAHTIENAHPFAFDNIVGAHNGTLEKFCIKKLHGNEKEVFGTDSEAVFNHINHSNVQSAIDLMWGAWALVWYDKRNNSLNFLRNDKRPLFYAYSKDRTTIYWASEQGMLDFILRRNNVEKFEDNFFLCEPDTHISWTVPDDVNKAFEPPTKVECKRPPQPVVEYNRSDYDRGGQAYGFGSYHHNRSDNVGFQTGSANSTNSRSTSGAQNSHGRNAQTWSPNFNVNTDKFRPPYKDCYGKTMNKVQFNQLISSGCVFCQDNQIKWGTFIQPLKNDMDGRKLFLCKDCFDEDDVRELVREII